MDKIGEIIRGGMAEIYILFFPSGIKNERMSNLEYLGCDMIGKSERSERSDLTRLHSNSPPLQRPAMSSERPHLTGPLSSGSDKPRKSEW